MKFIALLMLGLGAGALSGVTGIGGGTIIVPALIYLFGFSQHLAQGTTLALLVPPIGILAAWNYYNKGYVDIMTACLIAIGFVIGSELSSRFAIALSEQTTRRVFSVTLVIIAVHMFFSGPKT